AVETGGAMIYNGISNRVYKTAFQRRDDCLSHETYPEPIALAVSARENTAEQLFEAVRQQAQESGTMQMALERDLVVKVECRQCQTSQTIMRPLQKVGVDQAICPECKQTSKPDLEHSVVSGSELAQYRLSELGIPPFDMVRVELSKGEKVFLLDADRDTAMGAQPRGTD
ncbi:MAG: hypothetical protein QGG09_12910, partial [Pirellulaceae bacterium]|nr:hypothetical protein [Pirellulaceae bacterium]